jgi:NADPH-ferrihemoprotein reductase
MFGARLLLAYNATRSTIWLSASSANRASLSSLTNNVSSLPAQKPHGCYYSYNYSNPPLRAVSSLLTVRPLHNQKSYRSRFFSGVVHALKDSDSKQPIRIIWGSQGGTAQIFAQQLVDALEEMDPDREITVQGLHESKTPDALLTPRQGIHVMLVSVTGVGEPSDNSRGFYDWIMNKDKDNGKETNNGCLQGLEYAVFGLGNEKAHPNHYNVIGKNLDARFEELGASRIMELGLGDDGECIEDDFDNWMDALCKRLAGTEKVAGDDTNSSAVAETEGGDETETAAPSATTFEPPPQVIVVEEDQPKVFSPGVAISESGFRILSKKYPTLKLKQAENDRVRESLFHLQGTDQQFYQDKTAWVDVISNKLLTANAGESGLHEMRISLRDHYNHSDLTYETGDHLMIYPRNSQCIVESYLDSLDVDRHAIIDAEQDPKYPHPSGISVYETLSHCIDLGAAPSPAFSRLLLGRKELNYKDEIANPRRTVIDLMRESSGKQLSLEDLLYNMTPMRHRYYSIASSSKAHPKEIYLAFRPVKYMSSRGIMREGVATSYMSHKGVVSGDNFARVAAVVNPNPTFRLPKDPLTPILMVAGGCGVAPIRAFLEERLSMNVPKLGPGRLYLGFRNPDDEVYRKLVDKAIEAGAMTDVKVSYSFGCTEPDQRCMLVSSLMRSEGAVVWEHLESGGYTYLCGGARTFGAAIEGELLNIIHDHGKLDFEQASAYIRNLSDSGRLCEDLAD